MAHQDGTCAVHRFSPSDFRGDLVELRDSAKFVTAAVIEGCLAWRCEVGVYDVAPDGLWLHAHGFCDGKHNLDREGEQ